MSPGIEFKIIAQTATSTWDCFFFFFVTVSPTLENNLSLGTEIARIKSFLSSAVHE